jgi:acetyl esterase
MSNRCSTCDAIGLVEIARAGVHAQLIDYAAMPHGFLNFPRFARDAKPAIGAVIATQRAALVRR